METNALTQSTPEARLHDIGELTVINDDNGRCHHKVAMVLVFNNTEEAAACMEAGMVRLLPSNDLNAEAVEHMNHG